MIRDLISNGPLRVFGTLKNSHFGMLYLFYNDDRNTHPSTKSTQGMDQQNQILTSVNTHLEFYGHVKNAKKAGPLRVFYGIYFFLFICLFVFCLFFYSIILGYPQEYTLKIS